MKICGWGRYPVIDSNQQLIKSHSQSSECVKRPFRGIARGLGRSYGDSGLAKQTLNTAYLNHFIDFQAQTGRLRCASGVTLAELIELFLPQGWFLAVTPGTKFITVGGAVASDVHGKNHHVLGCFSECVESINILLANGETVECSRNQHAQLFHATCGGMGLTGVILAVSLRLQKVTSAFMKVRTVKTSSLEETFACFEENSSTSYSVAWIDCLAGKRQKGFGRSLISLAEHDTIGELKTPPCTPRSVPMNMPSLLLNSQSMKLFNNLYYHHARNAEKRAHIHQFFYPLDSLLNWNRLYGRQGFLQYQFLLPKNAGIEGFKAMLKPIIASGRGSFLAVLKLLGKENRNYLSFPQEGYSLALDFKINTGIFEFLDGLDKILIDYGGRVYLAKDARMNENTFKKSYPKWESFQTVRDQYGATEKFQSMQSKRLGL